MNNVDAIPFKEPNAPAGTPPLLLFFYEQAVKDERASRNGPPIFDTAHFVRVVVAGSKGGEGPLYEMWRRKDDGTEKTGEGYKRFGKPYEDWKHGRAIADAGTPLEQWPLMETAMVAAFRAANVYTVQQLAGLSDGALDTGIRRGGREWRAKAQAYLDEARSAAGDAEARAQLARQQEEIDELKRLLKESLKKQNTQGFEKSKRAGRSAGGDDHVDVAEEADLRL